MFVLFLICAGAPIVCLAGLSWLQVSAELRDQASRRLYAASRSLGMHVLERLLRGAELLGAPGEGERDALAERFDGVAERRAGGAWRPRFGPAPPALADAPGDEAALARGDTILRLAQEGGRPLLLMLRRSASGADVAGRVRLDRLFDMSSEDLFPVEAEFCVFDDAEAPLACSLPGRPAPPALPSERGAPALMEWQVSGNDYLAVPWPLFLKGNFHVPEWTVVVAEPAAIVYAPVRGFRIILAGVSSLALLLASLLSVQQIRRRLRPLERLTHATARVAGSDFAVRVDVDADDEFAELGAAFNAMALRLDSQFQALERVIEVDRAILAARDEAALAEAFLEPLRRLYPCRLMALGVPRREASEPRRVYLAGASGRVVLRELELQELTQGGGAQPPLLELFPASRLPEPFRAALPREVAECFVVPISDEAGADGFVVACHGEGEVVPRERTLYLRQLCEQLSAALRGAALRRQNERLRRFDPLTGLPNQRWLEQRVAERAQPATGGPRARLGLARVSIDGLDRVRSIFGPLEVEGIVRRVGDRLRAEGGQRAVRLDGGEFGLFAEGATAEEVTRSLRAGCDSVRAALEADPRAAYLRARAGAAVVPDDARDAGGLLACADAALRHAASEGGRIVFYAPAMNAALERRVRLEDDLARAIERGELRLHFQPILDARTRQTIGAEALLRWKHAGLGMVEPLQFIPLAEEIGLIEPIGNWVLRETCRCLRSWQDANLLPPRISVNVSPRQVRPALLAEVMRHLRDARISPALLGLEITESSLLADDPATAETLEAIHRAGIEISVDDFGTGYSSLGYLKRFPIDTLKLDRVFVQGATKESDKRAITEAVLAMARELGLRVVAEGVETEEQLHFLAERGCPAVQGFLFTEPLPEGVFRSWLAAG